jgi:hypothetical protein
MLKIWSGASSQTNSESAERDGTYLCISARRSRWLHIEAGKCQKLWYDITFDYQLRYKLSTKYTRTSQSSRSFLIAPSIPYQHMPKHLL